MAGTQMPKVHGVDKVVIQTLNLRPKLRKKEYPGPYK